MEDLELSMQELKERKIMKLLLKCKRSLHHCRASGAYPLTKKQVEDKELSAEELDECRVMELLLKCEMIAPMQGTRS